MSQGIRDDYNDIEGEQDRFLFLAESLNSNEEEILEFCYDEFSNIQISDADLDENSISKLTQIMVDGLNHNNDLIRRWCCFFVGRNQIKSEIDKIIIIAEQDKNLSVRYNAIGALGNLLAIKALPNLIKLLSSTDTFKYGRNKLLERDVSLSEQAFVALSNIGFDEYLPEIIEYYEDADELVRIRLIPALANYPTPKVRELIREELFSENSARDGNILFGYASIIPVAIKALVKLEDEESIPIIARLGLEHENYNVRKAAILSLVSCLEQGHRYPFSDEGFSFDTMRNCSEAIELLFTYLEQEEISDEEKNESRMLLRFGTYPPQLRVTQFLEFLMHPDRVRIEQEELENINSILEQLKEYWIGFFNKLIQDEEE